MWSPKLLLTLLLVLAISINALFTAGPTSTTSILSTPSPTSDGNTATTTDTCVKNLMDVHSLASSFVLTQLLRRQDTDSSDSLEKTSYPNNICYATNPRTGDSDYSAPCNRIDILSAVCVFGIPEAAILGMNDNPDVDLESFPVQSQQQIYECMCHGTGEFWAVVEGCMNCERMHGMPMGPGYGHWMPKEVVTFASSEFCKASATAALGPLLASSVPTVTPPPRDILGTSKIAVSYYYTAPTLPTTTMPWPTESTSGGRLILPPKLALIVAGVLILLGSM